MESPAEALEPGEITVLIEKWQSGSREAEAALFAALYEKLHSIATRYLRAESPGQTLGPTALVHEAYLRFTRSEQLNITNRAHFLALTARVMHRILVDRARARRARKRDGLMLGEEFFDLIPTDQDADQILAVDLAMETLSKDSPEQCQLVELRYFAGYSEEQCAEILGTSARTVRRHWQIARTRLKVLIDGSASEAQP